MDRGRLVTQVIYLEDPAQALPISLPKDEIPVVSLNPSEDPLRVAAALGRVVAIVRMGGRRPTADDMGFGGYGVVGPGAGGPCPFAQGEGVRAATCRAGRSAAPRRRRAGPGCPRTSTSATAATTASPPGSAATAAWPALTRATP